MELHDAIYKRRSIRRYTGGTLSARQINDLIDAAAQAPSAKNRQPWFFYVINDPETKRRFVSQLNSGIDVLYEQYCRVSVPRPDILSAKNSVRIMEQAAAIILVKYVIRYDRYHDDGVCWPIHAADIEVADLLSIGAAVQNMLLAAEEMQLGTLWVCDIFYAYPELTRFLKTDAPILSAVCIGYPAESPAKRPRLSVQDISAILSDKEE